MMDPDVESLEGWLLKRKSKEKFSFMAKDNKRWFKIKEVKGSDSNELALCYFKSAKDDEARGWVYLRDVLEIDEAEERTFTLRTYSRTMSLEAQTRAEYRLWLQGIVNLCPAADISKVKSVTRTYTSEEKASAKPSSSDKSSGNSHSEEVYSSRPAERKESENQPRRNSRTSEALNDDSDTERRSKNDRDTNRNRSGSSDSRNDARREREDHRLGNQVYRSGTTSGTTTRLHEYIRGESDPNALENNSSAREPVDASKINSDAKEESRQSPDSKSVPVPKRQINGNATGEDGSDLETFDLSAQAAGRRRDSGVRQRRNSGRSESSDSDSEAQPRTRPIHPPLEEGSNTDAKSTNSMDEVGDTGARRGESDHIQGKGMKGKPLPMPMGAPPVRRARDAMDESEPSAPKRASVDEMITNQRRLSTDLVESDDENVDFKAERRRYDSFGNDEGIAGKKGDSRPPRPPASSKPPYAQKASVPAPVTAPPTHRATTPPRRPADPGIPVDANFVTENWDDSMESESSPVVRTKNKSAANEPGVRADENWLEENFDD